MQPIAILKEPTFENRVCLVPTAVKKIVFTYNSPVWVEESAGILSGFTDEEYRDAGAHIGTRLEVLRNANFIFSINPIYKGELIEEHKSFVGIFNMVFHKNRIQDYINQNVTVYSLDLIPRTTKAQTMDVLSSMASLSGYKAVIKAAELYGSVIPMLTTAAGTLRPATVLVIGAGVAGLQAIATAKRLGAMVEAFDVRTAAGEEVKSLGAKFIEVEGAVEGKDAGGYAVDQTDEYKQKQKKLLEKYIAKASIIISTANIPGRQAPLLIDKSDVERMDHGSVIIDLASEQGGNCALTQDKKLIEYQGVKILGNSYLTRDMPRASTQMLSNNYLSFFKHLFDTPFSDFEKDPIINGCTVIAKGEVAHPKLILQSQPA